MSRKRQDVYYHYSQRELAAALDLDTWYYQNFNLPTDEERATIPKAPFYVCGNDGFFSGYKSEIDVVVIPCASIREAKDIICFLEQHEPGIKYLRIVYTKPRPRTNRHGLSHVPTYRPRAINIAWGNPGDEDDYSPETDRNISKLQPDQIEPILREAIERWKAARKPVENIPAIPSL